MATSDDTGPDWHLQEWAEALGKKQADLVNELGWHKNSAFRLWHGEQPYRRDQVNEVSKWLGIEPFELLMPPAEAQAIRQVRAHAAAIAAAGDPNQFLPQAPVVRTLGRQPKRA